MGSKGSKSVGPSATFGESNSFNEFPESISGGCVGEKSACACGAYEDLMSFYGDSVTGGGCCGDGSVLFSGGANDGTTLGEISQYDKSLNSQTKEKLIDDIISGMKTLGFDVKGKDREDTIQKILDKIPNSKKKGFKSDVESHKQVCDKIARVFNDKYGKIIDTTLDPSHVCQKVAELVESLGTGMHAEFLLVNNEVKKVLKNLFYLKDELNMVMKPLVETLDKSDDLKLKAKATKYTELYRLLTEELTRQIEMLKNLLNISLLPSETELASLLKHSEELPGLIEKLGEDVVGTSRFSNLLSQVLRGIGSSAELALVIDRALKRVGLTIEEYARSENLKIINEKIRDVLMKKDLSDEELHKFLQSAQLLMENFFRRKDIDNKLKKMNAKEGGEDYVGYGEDDTACGGAEDEEEHKSVIDKRVEDKRSMKKILLRAFNKQLVERFDKIVLGLNNLAEKIGSTLPLSELLDKLRSALTLLMPAVMKKHIYIALSGYYNDAISKEKRESFLAQLKLVNGSLDALIESSQYVQYQEIFKVVKDNIRSLIELIDTYSDKIAQKFGSGEDDDLGEENEEDESKEGGAKEETATIKDAPAWRSIGTMYDVIRKFDYYYKVAQIRENLKRTAGELDYYGEKYVDIRAAAIAKEVDKIKTDSEALIKKLKDGEGFGVKSPHNGIPTDANTKAQEEYIRLFIKAQTKSKVTFWRTIEAIDEYMRVFTDGLAKHPEDIKDIKSMLDEIDVIHDWYSESSGKDLHQLFDSFPTRREGLGTGQAAGDRTVFPQEKWKNAAGHYFKAMENIEAEAAAAAGAAHVDRINNLPGNPFIAVELKSSAQNYPSFADDDVGFTGRKEARKIIKGVTVLKNILNIFIHIGNKFGGQELYKKVFMTPTQIYNNLCDYLEASAFNMGLPAPSIEYFVKETGANDQIVTLYKPDGTLAGTIPEPTGLANRVDDPAQPVAIVDVTTPQNTMANVLAILRNRQRDIATYLDQNPTVRSKYNKLRNTYNSVNKTLLQLDEMVNNRNNKGFGLGVNTVDWDTLIAVITSGKLGIWTMEQAIINAARQPPQQQQQAQQLQPPQQQQPQQQQQQTQRLQQGQQALQQAVLQRHIGGGVLEDAKQILGNQVFRISADSLKQYLDGNPHADLVRNSPARTAPRTDNDDRTFVNTFINLISNYISMRTETINNINKVAEQVRNLSATLGLHSVPPVTYAANRQFSGSYEGGIQFNNFPNLNTYNIHNDLSDFDAQYSNLRNTIMLGATAGDAGGNNPDNRKTSTFVQNFGVYMRGVDRGFDGDEHFKLLDNMFIHAIKSMCAKILTVVGTYDVFERPFEIQTMSPVRLIIGGADEVPKVENNMVELYLRLPLLAEFYRKLFSWHNDKDNSFIKDYEKNYQENDQTRKFAEKISIVPEIEGTFSGLIRLMFKKIRYVTSSSYSDSDISEIIREINVVYSQMLQKSNKDKVVMDTIYEFVNEINRRYGIVKQGERNKYEKEFGWRYDYAAETDKYREDTDKDFAILPGEEEIDYEPKEGYAPSIQYESGLSADAKKKLPRFSIRDDHYRLFYRFRCKLDDSFREISGNPLGIKEKSLNSAIKSAKNQLDKETDQQQRFKIVSKLIRGSDIYGKPDYYKYLMFHETVITGLNTLSAIHTLLWLFQNRILTLDLNTIEGLKRPGDRTFILNHIIDDWKKRYYGENRNDLAGFTGIERDINETFIKVYKEGVNIPWKILVAGGNPANNVAYIYKRNYLAELFESIWGISKDLQGLVTSSFESSGEKVFVRLSFTGLRQCVEELFASVRYFMDLLRPHIDREFFNNYSDKERPGSYYWLQEQIMEKIIVGRDIEQASLVGKKFKSPYVSLDRLTEIINNTLNHLVENKVNLDKYLRQIIYFVAEQDFNTSSHGTGVGQAGHNLEPRDARAQGILFNDSEGLEKLMAKNMGNVRLINPNYTARFKHLYSWKNTDFNNNRSVLYAFNQLLAKYIGVFFDKSIDKIYVRLIDQFANGAFNQQVMDQNNTFPDMKKANVTIGDQPSELRRFEYELNETGLPIPATGREPFPGVLGTPPVLTGPLHGPNAGQLRREHKEKSSEFLGPNNLLSAKITDEINAEQGSINELFEQYDDKKINYILYTSLSIILKNILTSRNESNQQSIYLSDSLADTTFYMKETYRANLPIFRNLFKELMNKCEYYKNLINQDKITIDGSMRPGNMTQNKARVFNTKLLDQVVDGCKALVTSIEQVMRELGDDPKYLETYQNSIQEYSSLHNKIPLMPISSLLYVLRNVGVKNSSSFLALFPLHSPGTVQFKLNYGSRSLLGDPTSKVIIDHLPGAKEVLDNFNTSVNTTEAADLTKYDNYVSNLVKLLRFVVNAKHYKGNLTPYVQDIFRLTTGGPVSIFGQNYFTLINLADQTTHANVYGLFTRTDFTKQYNGKLNEANKGMISIFNGKVANIAESDKFNMPAYATIKSLEDTVSLTESSFKDNKIEEIVKHIRGNITAITDLPIINILDLNIVPINVHALMRDIPLVNLYNYSYTFDRLIVDLYYGLNEDFGGKIVESLCSDPLNEPGINSMAGLPLDPVVSTNRDTFGQILNRNDTRSGSRSIIKSTRELFVALLINPYRKVWTDEEYQFLDAIFRGSGNLPLDRPKFLSDQIHNKLMFRDATEVDDITMVNNPLAINRAFENPYHTRMSALRGNNQPTMENRLWYIKPTNETNDPNDYEFNRTDMSHVNIDPNFKKMVQLIGKLRFNTRFVRNLFFLVNLYRSLRLKLRMDLTYNKNVVVKSHAVTRPDNTEFIVNQTKEDVYKGTRMYPKSGKP